MKRVESMGRDEEVTGGELVAGLRRRGGRRRFHELGTPRFSRHAKVYQQLLSERHPCYELASGCKNPPFDRCKSVQFDFEWHKRKRSCTYGAERDVVHHGYCSALNLAAEFKIADFLKSVINFVGQDP